MERSLEVWRTRFEELDQCPWPGPRPLKPSDPAEWLCGRGDDERNFRKDVDDNRVVFLAGSSGVGKTSLLQRGLIPALEAAGYIVAMCRDWSDTATFDKPSMFLGKQVAREVTKKDPSLPSDATVIGALQRHYKGRAVIVLDQFEELIRDEPEFADRLFAFLATLSRKTDLKLVVSLRSEHMHELRPFEHQIQSYSTSHYYLDEVDESAAPAITLAGNLDPEKPAIRADVAAEVAKLWSDARQKQKDSGSSRVNIGLLHLQGVLYALHARTKGAPVTMDALMGLRRDLERRDTEEDAGVALFTQALARAVEVKLDRCRTASEEVGVDRYLVEGAKATLSSAVRHLSSAGFKLVRDAHDLAEATIGTDLDQLRGAIAASCCARRDGADGHHLAKQEDALFQVLTDALRHEGQRDEIRGDLSDVDFLSASTSQVALAADARTALGDDVDRVGWAQRLNDEGLSPFDVDPREATQGPLMGRSPTAVFIEEYRRFAFALEWMRASVLCRVTATSSGATRVALIHDGFGPALERWSNDQADRPSRALYGLTAPRGAEFVWPSDASSYRPEFDAPNDDEPRVLANLRWRGSSVIATAFRRIVFANCDFRGAVFIRCRFEGVVFVNCLLDGAMFTDCTVTGEVSNRPTEWVDDPTPFIIDGSESKAVEMAPYRGVDSPRAILSQLPFYPARVVDSLESARSIHRETGSIVIVGGRVSTLTFRAMTFKGGASIAFRETVGSGLDFVEHGRVLPGANASDADPARIELTGSLLRHLTVTTAPHRDEDDYVPPVHFDVHGSVLVQAWYGDDLHGTLDVTDSQLMNTWNGSDPTKFVATARSGTKYRSLVGFTVDDSCHPVVDEPNVADAQALYDASIAGEPLSLKPTLIALDYRRDASQEDGRTDAVGE